MKNFNSFLLASASTSSDPKITTTTTTTQNQTKTKTKTPRTPFNLDSNTLILNNTLTKLENDVNNNNKNVLERNNAPLTRLPTAANTRDSINFEASLINNYKSAKLRKYKLKMPSNSQKVRLRNVLFKMQPYRMLFNKLTTVHEEEDLNTLSANLVGNPDNSLSSNNSHSSDTKDSDDSDDAYNETAANFFGPNGLPYNEEHFYAQPSVKQRVNYINENNSIYSSVPLLDLNKTNSIQYGNSNFDVYGSQADAKSKKLPSIKTPNTVTNRTQNKNTTQNNSSSSSQPLASSNNNNSTNSANINGYPSYALAKMNLGPVNSFSQFNSTNLQPKPANTTANSNPNNSPKTNPPPPPTTPSNAANKSKKFKPTSYYTSYANDKNEIDYSSYLYSDSTTELYMKKIIEPNKASHQQSYRVEAPKANQELSKIDSIIDKVFANKTATTNAPKPAKTVTFSAMASLISRPTTNINNKIVPGVEILSVQHEQIVKEPLRESRSRQRLDESKLEHSKSRSVSINSTMEKKLETINNKTEAAAAASSNKHSVRAYSTTRLPDHQTRPHKETLNLLSTRNKFEDIGNNGEKSKLDDMTKSKNTSYVNGIYEYADSKALLSSVSTATKSAIDVANKLSNSSSNRESRRDGLTRKQDKPMRSASTASIEDLKNSQSSLGVKLADAKQTEASRSKTLAMPRSLSINRMPPPPSEPKAQTSSKTIVEFAKRDTSRESNDLRPVSRSSTSMSNYKHLTLVSQVDSKSIKPKPSKKENNIDFLNKPAELDYPKSQLAPLFEPKKQQQQSTTGAQPVVYKKINVIPPPVPPALVSASGVFTKAQTLGKPALTLTQSEPLNSKSTNSIVELSRKYETLPTKSTVVSSSSTLSSNLQPRSTTLIGSIKPSVGRNEPNGLSSMSQVEAPKIRIISKDSLPPKPNTIARSSSINFLFNKPDESANQSKFG